MINSLGFVGHPIDLEHLYKMLGGLGAVARKLPAFSLRQFLKKVPPYRLTTVRNIRSSRGALADCPLMICPMLPADMVSLDEESSLNRVVQAVRKCERLGARIVTLGGFASVIGNEGEEAAKRCGVAVTSGNTYTAALAVEGVIKAAYYMDIDLPRSTLAVIGATGDIGSACARALSKKVGKLNLAARNEPRLKEFADRVNGAHGLKAGIYLSGKEAVKDADIVITVTTAVASIIEPEDLKPGAVVCDVAIPANIAKRISAARDDVFVFEGGLARLPYQNEITNRRFNELVPSGSVYGCLAEGVALAFEGKFENYSIGRGNITEEKMADILRIARKHGMQLSEFFYGYKFYSEEDIDKIRQNSKRNLARGSYVKK